MLILNIIYIFTLYINVGKNGSWPLVGRHKHLTLYFIPTNSSSILIYNRISYCLLTE